MKFLFKLTGLATALSAMGGGVYGISKLLPTPSSDCSECQTLDGEVYLMVSTLPDSASKPSDAKEEEPKDEAKKDYHCQWSETSNNSEDTDCELIKIDFDSDKKSYLIADFQTQSDASVITKYSELSKQTKYILKTNKKHMTAGSTTVKIISNSSNDDSHEHQLNMSIVGEFSADTKNFLAKSSAVIAQLKSVESYISAFSLSGGGCFLSGSNEDKASGNTCKIINTSEKTNIKNINFKNLTIPNTNNENNFLQKEKSGDYYIIQLDSEYTVSDENIKNQTIIHVKETEVGDEAPAIVATFTIQALLFGDLNAENKEIVVLE